MADTPAAGAPGAPSQQNAVIPGTLIPVPVGHGVETLTAIQPPFRNNAPPWYTPPDANGRQSVWSMMGCAIPQPGRYLQTNNVVLYDVVRVAGAELFDTIWQADDRKFERYPSRDTLYKIHQLIVYGRKRLADRTVLDNASPMVPARAKPSPRMFVVYPVPYYGPLGCVQPWLNDCITFMSMMLTEAMQHPDNELSFHITKQCHDVLYGYLKWILVDMATKFFGVDAKVAGDDAYVIPPAAWAAFDPTQFSVPAENTTTRPPMGWSATDLDLEPIRGIPVEDAIPFLQPWPDSQLKYASGGIWSGSQLAAGGAQTAVATQGQAVNPLYAKAGPPNS